MTTELVVQLTRLAGLSQLAAGWKQQPNGARYAEALLSFVGTLSSVNTRRSYAYSIGQFFLWYEVRFGRVPTPDGVSRAEAAAYAEWLKAPTDEAIQSWLRASQRDLELACYQAVKAHPGCKITTIRQVIGRPDTDEEISDLDVLLASMVRKKLLRRRPTIAQIRESSAGTKDSDYERAQLTHRVDPETFTYTVRKPTKLGPSTRAIRIRALSSFWVWMTESGENTGDDSSLLRHNIWQRLGRQVGRLVPGAKRASRVLKTPGIELFVEVLATCFAGSHGEAAKQAAWAAVRGSPMPAGGAASLYDLRDRALLLLLLYTALRAEEVGPLRRRDLGATPAVLTIEGKGERTRLLAVPEVVLRAFEEFHGALDRPAARALPGRPQTLVSLLCSPDAPLVPALKHWGKNAPAKVRSADQLKGLSQQAVTMILQCRGKAAGYRPGTDSYQRLHVHGLRHLAAHYALGQGVPLPVVQAVLGHASLATTGLYLEEHDPEKMTLWPAQQGQPAAAPAPDLTVIDAPPEQESP